MPQVHNKSLSFDTANAFGKNSRYMASLKFTENSLRRVNVLSTLENRFTKKKLDFFERQANVQNFKYERIKNRLVDNLHKRIAYKLVLKNHSISKAKDYQKALDQRYSYAAFHHEVNDMLQYMKPERMRERKARSLLHENKNAYDNIIFQNTQKFNKLFPEKKTWMSRRMRMIAEQQAQEVVKEPTPLPTRERNAKKSLATLRRRIITLDDSKPNSPQKVPNTPAISPTKTPSLSKPPSSSSRLANRRQEISMTMMKKQKSFVDSREITKDDLILRIESKMKSLSVDDEEEDGSEAKDINNNAVKDNKKDEVTSDVITDTNTNADKKKQSFLPSIVNQTQPVQKSKQPNLQSKTPKDVKLPVLKMSRPVKAQ